MSKLVSVVVPAYNVGPYIEDCINSVVNQTYSKWELIVVDDGSTDNTYDLAKKTAGDDRRIRIHKQNNQGVSMARNTGLGMATGTDVIFLDGDDFWLPECLAKLVAAKDKSRAQVGYCGYNHFYINGYNRNYRYGYPDGNILIEAINGEVRFHLGALLIDKKVLIDINLQFTEGCLIGQDLEFMLKLAAVASYKSVSENLLMYRVRPNSAIKSKWKWEKHFHAVKGLRRAAEFIIDKSRNSKDLPIIRRGLDIRTGKLIAKFLWRIVKTNDYEDANRIIKEVTADPYYTSVLENFPRSELEFLDRIKYGIVLSNNRMFWSLAKYM